jgi:hypothetical protein
MAKLQMVPMTSQNQKGGQQWARVDNEPNFNRGRQQARADNEPDLKKSQQWARANKGQNIKRADLSQKYKNNERTWAVIRLVH